MIVWFYSSITVTLKYMNFKKPLYEKMFLILVVSFTCGHNKVNYFDEMKH